MSLLVSRLWGGAAFGLCAVMASQAFVGPAHAQNAEACQDLVERLEAAYTQREGEYGTALKEAAPADPLILNMKDGSTVDLRGEDVSAGPTENWFGDPPRRKQVGDALTAMRSFNDASDETACREAAAGLSTLLREWGEDVPVVEAVLEDAEDIGLDIDAAEGDQTQAEASSTGDPALLEEDASQDDTGEGDNYGAPEATAAVDATGDVTEDTNALPAQPNAAPADTASTDAGEGSTEESPTAPVATATPQAATSQDDATAPGNADQPFAETRASTGEGGGLVADEASTPAADATATPVSDDTLEGAAASDAPGADAASEEASAANSATGTNDGRMREVPGRITIQTPDGREVDPSNNPAIRRRVPIENPS